MDNVTREGLCKLIQEQSKAYFNTHADNEQRNMQRIGMTDTLILEEYMGYLRDLVGDQFRVSKKLMHTNQQAYKLYVTKQQNNDFERNAVVGFMNAVEMLV